MKLESTILKMITLLLLAVVWPSECYLLTDDACMAPAPCHCARNQIICSGFHLTSIPAFEPTTTPVKDLIIYFPGNNLTTIPANAFANINTTQASTIAIYFQSNKIHLIDFDAFVGIEDVITELRFEDNRLSAFPAAFTRLTSLKKLRMEANPITTFDPVVMSEMSLSLTEFAAPAVNLTSWPYGLNHLRHLEYLLLYGIPFHQVPLDAFYGFGSYLTELAITGSFNDEVPTAVCFLRNLKILSVNSKKLQTSTELLTLHERCQNVLSGIDPFIHV